jgi:hypothetical protein
MVILINNNYSEDMENTDYFPRVMYVNSKEGLRVRLEPSTNSPRIGSYVYGQRVILHEKSSSLDIIDGITGYWYKAGGSYYTGGGSFEYKGETYYRVWIFGGYLSEQLPEDAPVVIGNWDVEDNNRRGWTFSANNRYIEGINYTGSANSGKWSLKNNILTITSKPPMEDIFLKDFDESTLEPIIINVTVNNRNNIILKYPDGETVKLIRNDKEGLD